MRPSESTSITEPFKRVVSHSVNEVDGSHMVSETTRRVLALPVCDENSYNRKVRQMKVLEIMDNAQARFPLRMFWLTYLLICFFCNFNSVGNLLAIPASPRICLK